MYVIIWEYQVKVERIDEFEQIYHPEGQWAELFKNANGFLGTELFRDKTHHQKYLTIDRWESAKDYEDFRAQWKEEYEVLDAQCEGLTEKETMLGKCETVNYETR